MAELLKKLSLTRDFDLRDKLSFAAAMLCFGLGILGAMALQNQILAWAGVILAILIAAYPLFRKRFAEASKKVRSEASQLDLPEGVTYPFPPALLTSEDFAEEEPEIYPELGADEARTQAPRSG